MGMMGTIFGTGRTVRDLGGAVSDVAEVFVGNKAERERQAHERYRGAVEQYTREFTLPAQTWFDAAVNGINRLPRPAMALGTLGLFVFAMVDPEAFTARMDGLAVVPEPLWWLLGVIISFYFGARELHHQRTRVQVTAQRRNVVPPEEAEETEVRPVPRPADVPILKPRKVTVDATDPEFNAALEEWRALR